MWRWDHSDVGPNNIVAFRSPFLLLVMMTNRSCFARGDTRWKRWAKGLLKEGEDEIPILTPMAATDAKCV